MAMARAYADAVKSRGGHVLLRDLYRMKFEPCLSADELPWAGDYKPHADITLERGLLNDVDVFSLVYPLWFNSPPAILKGYAERVFGTGFGYASTAFGTEPLLAGRKLISISCSGAPQKWVKESGALAALRLIFDDHLAAVCGFGVMDHLHFGGIVPGMRADAVDLCAGAVKGAVARHFPRDEAEARALAD